MKSITDMADYLKKYIKDSYMLKILRLYWLSKSYRTLYDSKGWRFFS